MPRWEVLVSECKILKIQRCTDNCLRFAIKMLKILRCTDDLPALPRRHPPRQWDPENVERRLKMTVWKILGGRFVVDPSGPFGPHEHSHAVWRSFCVSPDRSHAVRHSVCNFGHSFRWPNMGPIEGVRIIYKINVGLFFLKKKGAAGAATKWNPKSKIVKTYWKIHTLHNLPVSS